MAIRWKTTDSHDEIRYTALDAHKQPVNLIGATARFLMGKRGDADSVIINEPAQVVDEMAGKLAYELTEIATLEAGTFNAEFHVEWPDGSRKVFPSEGYLAVTVAPSLDVSKVGEVEERIILRVSQIEEFKDEIVAEVDGFKATVGQAEDAAVEAEVQADYAKAQGDYAKIEADRVAGMDVSKLTAQLAEKAQKEVAESAHERIDTLVINSGNANAEVDDAKISTAKNKTFTTLRNRLEDSEQDVEGLGNFKIKNLVKNGNFNNDLTNWTNTSGVTVENGKAKISIANGISFQQSISLVTGHKYYVSLLHRADSVERNLDLTLRNGTTFITPVLFSLPVGSVGGTTSETRYSKIFTVNQAVNSIGFSRNGASTLGFHYVDNVILIDLTEMYGVGQEPVDKTEIEVLISLYGAYIEGTKRLGNREFSFHLFEQIKKSQSFANKSVYEELRGNIHQRNYRVDKKFKAGEAIISTGDITLSDVSNPKYQRNNNTALKVTVNSPTNFRVDFPLSTPIDLYKKEFALNFYLPRESTKTPRQAKFAVLAIYLTTLNGTYIIYPENDRRYPGWNAVIGNPMNRNASSSAQEVDLTNVTNIRIHLNVDGTITEPYDIYFDSFTSWDYISIPTVRLEFDDAIHTVYDNAFPLMAERGMRGAAHVITKNIITENPLEYTTNNGLIRMHDVGWDICSHSVNHHYISTLTEQEQIYELEQSQKDLLSLGLRNGPQFYIAPYGDNTLYATEQARKFYVNYRMTGYRPGISILPQLPYAMECIDAGVRGLSGVTALIDKAVETGGHLPLMWHGEIGETWDGIMWQTGEFKDMLDYLIEKSVKVVTYSDQFPNSQIR